MYTTSNMPEQYLASYATILVFGAQNLRCHEARRTGIEAISGKAVYELIDLNHRPVSNILYVIDNSVLVPVAQYRANVLAMAAEYAAAVKNL